MTVDGNRAAHGEMSRRLLHERRPATKLRAGGYLGKRDAAWFRRIQTGRVQQYLLLLAIAAILIALVFAVSSGVLVQAAQ